VSDKQRDLSRMEYSVLGQIANGAPCTAYWIRRQFQLSRSSFFSGSAGAVYPAVRRLRERGLVAAAAVQSDRRAAEHYSLTKSGRNTLREWLCAPIPSEDVTFTVDPLRNRVYSLELLSAQQRRAFVSDALGQLREFLDVTIDEAEEKRLAGDRFAHLGSLGVIHETRARIVWLEEVQQHL